MHRQEGRSQGHGRTTAVKFMERRKGIKAKIHHHLSSRTENPDRKERVETWI